MALSLATVGAKITASFVNAIVARVNRQGLTSIIPTSVAGTGVTLNSTTGVVSFSASSTITINGAFTSEFKNYKIIANPYGSATGLSLFANLCLAGVANVVTYYYGGSSNAAGSATLTAHTGSNLTKWDVGRIHLNPGFSFTAMDIFSPQTSGQTTIDFCNFGDTGGGPIAIKASGMHLASVSYDGIQFTLSSGSITGTIQIYGYNN